MRQTSSTLRKSTQLLALALVMTSALAPCRAQGNELLQQVGDCIARGSLKLAERSSLQAGVRPRSVVTEHGPRQVSRDGGQRLILLTGQGEPFINLMIEHSQDGRFEDDREAVTAQMQFMHRKSGGTASLVTGERGSETVLLGLNNPSLDMSIISFYSLFEPKRALIATAYFLNQKPGRRAFATVEEYAVLRDKALRELQACLAQGQGSQGR
jgi:hypothetical protein